MSEDVLIGGKIKQTAAARETPAVLPLQCRSLGLTVAGKPLLHNIDLTLEQGSVTIVMGPNGAGKSLFLKLMHGLLEPSEGQVLCAGEPLAAHHVLQQAMVFQRPVLLRRSVAGNIDFALGLRDKSGVGAGLELLRLVGLEDKSAQPARLLSGGEQQRLALARALALQPQVLFLDEPTANLDPASTHMIEEIVRRIHQNGTKIIFVCHDAGQAQRLGDEIVFLHKGTVIEQQKAADFFSAPQSTAAADYLNGRLVF
ncbi:MAG: ATP-binding cassette domain-containing protein [Gammaproteobacteria bacterium]|nr:ATP-binding cassette domain-containing protein [Gammaproteobacteria bacterium]